MSKASYLLKNTGILAIGNFGSKILSFLLVPLYTAVLTTAEYGAYDIIYSTVNLLIPILTLNVADAMLRFPLEEGSDVPRLAHIGIGTVLASSAAVLIAQFIPEAPWASVMGADYVAAMFFTSALYHLLIVLARGCERMSAVAVAGALNTLAMATLNVILLLIFPMGLDGFFIAAIAGMTVPIAYLLFVLRDIVLVRSTSGDSGLLLKMAQYSLPLAMTIIGWWFINTSGRYIVTAFCGIDSNGLYSIAFKIPVILTTIVSIFTQAWQVSAIKDFDPNDADGFLSRTFDYIEVVLVLTCSILIVLSPALAVVLYSGDFFDAWVFVPFLLVLALFNAMSGMWGPFFSAEYDTVPMAVSTLLGGLVNIVFGIPLAIAFGVWGVIASNVAAGFVNWLYRGAKVRKHILVDFHMRRSLALYCVLILQGVLMALEVLPLWTRVTGSFMLFAALLVGYRKKLASATNTILGMFRSRA